MLHRLTTEYFPGPLTSIVWPLLILPVNRHLLYPIQVIVPDLPAAPGSVTAVNGPSSGRTRSVILTWTDTSSNETGFTIQSATNAAFTSGLTTVIVAPGTTTYTRTGRFGTPITTSGSGQ